jgi:DNA-directed RNA polymerase specialized sigma24 family protein
VEPKIERLLPDVWRLIRAGFVSRWETAGEGHTSRGTAVHVAGVADLDRAEELAVNAVFRGFREGRRGVFEELRASSFANAVTIDEAAVRELVADDIDRAIEAGDDAPLIGAEVAVELEDADTLRSVASAAVAALGADCQALVQKRWVEGKSDADAARELGIGRNAVNARERRVRHHVRHALRHAKHITYGPAAIDYLLSSTAVPQIMMQRIYRRIATKIQPVEPAPFRERVRWAIGAVVVAVLGLVAMAVFGPAG